MTSSSSIESLLDFIAAVPDKVVIALWSGIPCTGGSALQNCNKHRPGHAKRMAAHLKLWEQLYGNFIILAQAVVKKGGYLCMEWPFNCRYWLHPKVKQFLAIEGLKWIRMKVRACAHGQLIQKGTHAGKALTKAWRVMSNVPKLSDYLDLPCPGGHQHVTTHGAFTLASGKYPEGMADAFSQVLPTC